MKCRSTTFPEMWQKNNLKRGKSRLEHQMRMVAHVNDWIDCVVQSQHSFTRTVKQIWEKGLQENSFGDGGSSRTTQF